MGSWVPSPDVSLEGERLWVGAVPSMGSCSWRGTEGQQVLESRSHPMSPGSSAALPVLSCHICIFFNNLRERNICSGNIVPELRLEEGMSEKEGEIPLLQNSALITACPLRDFHPHGWHGLQTMAVGEASKVKSTSPVHRKPW